MPGELRETLIKKFQPICEILVKLTLVSERFTDSGLQSICQNRHS